MSPSRQDNFAIWQNSCSQFKTTKFALITFADLLGDDKTNRMLIFNSCVLVIRN